MTYDEKKEIVDAIRESDDGTAMGHVQDVFDSGMYSALSVKSDSVELTIMAITFIGVLAIVATVFFL